MSEDIANLVNKLFEAQQQMPTNIQYAVVMRPDMFYLARSHVRTGMFADCQRWLKRSTNQRIKVSGFHRTAKALSRMQAP